MHYTACIAGLFLCISHCLGIGRFCQSENECPSGQYCIRGACKCYNGQVLLNNRCVQDDYCNNKAEVYYNGQCYHLSSIGGRCTINEQCYGESYCIYSYCSCTQGMINMNGVCQSQNPNMQCGNEQVHVNGQCLSIAPIGGSCLLNAQCSGGAICFSEQCTCPAGTRQNQQTCVMQNCSKTEVLVAGTCVPRAIPGQQCQNSAQCLDGSQCSPTIHFCICPEGMNNIGGYCRKLSYTDPCAPSTTVYIDGNCLPVEKPGGQCYYDSQCLGGSACTNGYCNCPNSAALINGYCVGPASCEQNQILLNNRCFKQVGFNESCLISDQCPGNAICDYAARCVCPIGMRIVNGRCQSYDISECLDTEVMVNGRCMGRRIPGTSCLFTEQCLDGSACLGGYCTCPLTTHLLSGYCVRRSAKGKCGSYQVEVNGRCLGLAPPGYQCVSNLQCLASSTCPAGECVCSSGFVRVGDYCIWNDRRSTQCSTDQVLLNGRCYERVQIGQYCIDTAVCLGGSICYDNFCMCPAGTVAQSGQCRRQQVCSKDEVEVKGQCFPRVPVGQYCQFDGQCVRNSSCQGGICVCPEGSGCQPTGPCPEGQVFLYGGCYSIAQPGQYCQYPQQCQRNSTCIASVCRCPSGSRAQDGRCVHDTQCSDSQVMISGLCYTPANIGEFCYYTEQCSGNAECQMSRCMCPTGTVSFNGTCVVNSNCESYQVLVNGLCFDTVSVGMACQDSSQCIASASCVAGLSTDSRSRTCQCSNGTLFTGSSCVVSSTRCPPSTVFISDSFCQSLVQIGQFCVYTSQCMGYSVCSGQLCKCPANYVEVRNVCRRLN